MRGRDAPADVALRLEALAGRRDADRGALARIRQAAPVPPPPAYDGAAAGDPAPLLAAAFPDRIAQRRGEAGSFRLSGGGGAKLPATDALARAPLLAVGALELGAPPASGWPPRWTRPTCRRTASPRRWRAGSTPCPAPCCPAAGAAWARWCWTTAPLPADPAETARTLAARDRPQADALDWTDAARQLQARAALLRGLDPDVPDLSDAALAADAADWLEPHLLGIAGWRTRRRWTCTPAARPAGLGAAARLDRTCRPTCRCRRPGRDRLHGAGAAGVGAGAGVLRPSARRPRWPAAGCRCGSRCCRRRGGRSRSRRTSPGSGAAPGPMRGATCAGATRSTTGRRTGGVRLAKTRRQLTGRNVSSLRQLDADEQPLRVALPLGPL